MPSSGMAHHNFCITIPYPRVRVSSWAQGQALRLICQCYPCHLFMIHTCGHWSVDLTFHLGYKWRLIYVTSAVTYDVLFTVDLPRASVCVKAVSLMTSPPYIQAALNTKTVHCAAPPTFQSSIYDPLNQRWQCGWTLRQSGLSGSGMAYFIILGTVIVINYTIIV